MSALVYMTDGHTAQTVTLSRVPCIGESVKAVDGSNWRVETVRQMGAGYKGLGQDVEASLWVKRMPDDEPILAVDAAAETKGKEP